MFKQVPIVALMALYGCATPPPIDVKVQCLPMVTYTQAQDTEYDAELRALKASGRYPTTIQYLGDFYAMRNADRACMSGTKTGN